MRRDGWWVVGELDRSRQSPWGGLCRKGQGKGWFFFLSRDASRERGFRKNSQQLQLLNPAELLGGFFADASHLVPRFCGEWDHPSRKGKKHEKREKGLRHHGRLLAGGPARRDCRGAKRGCSERATCLPCGGAVPPGLQTRGCAIDWEPGSQEGRD